MVKKSIDARAPEPASYEAALGELEQLVGSMEGGQMPLDRLLGSHQRCVELLDFCRQRLKTVEDQLKLLDSGRRMDEGTE